MNPNISKIKGFAQHLIQILGNQAFPLIIVKRNHKNTKCIKSY